MHFGAARLIPENFVPHKTATLFLYADALWGRVAMAKENINVDWVALSEAQYRAHDLGIAFQYGDVTEDILNALRTGDIPTRGVCRIGVRPQRIEKQIFKHMGEADFLLNTIKINQHSPARFTRMESQTFSSPPFITKSQIYENVEVDWNALAAFLLSNCVPSNLLLKNFEEAKKPKAAIGRPGVAEQAISIFKNRRARGIPLAKTKKLEAEAILREWHLDGSKLVDRPKAKTIAEKISIVYNDAVVGGGDKL